MLPQPDPGQFVRSAVVHSALLDSELTRLRQKKGLTQEQVVRNLEWSPSKVIRVEGGRSPITKASWPGSYRGCRMLTGRRHGSLTCSRARAVPASPDSCRAFQDEEHIICLLLSADPGVLGQRPDRGVGRAAQYL